ncbi:hypothetical protein ACFQ0K_09865 [Nocardioides caeni]|uniref:Uncharacterized protein n=1 Tax=Nocardioides caeni TaxID=574700 RepID=A0A4S8N6J1_9ACTN|nr:hypothetical protein [Nocardioides caeni]THV11221.1 hypothetical protein E9934_13095 [Nocardioides caeni]
MTSHPARLRSRHRFAVVLLAAGLLLTACSDSDDDMDSSDTSRTSEESSAAGADAPPAAGEDPDQAGVETVLENLGTVLRTSLANVDFYEVDAATTTLTIRFSSGSKDDVTANCLISRSASQGLGLPADYRLVMSYPDGDTECARA